MYLTGDYRNIRQTHDVHRAIAAAQQRDSPHHLQGRRFPEDFFQLGPSFCPRKCMSTLSLLVVGLLVPITIIGFFDVNNRERNLSRPARISSESASRLFAALVPQTKHSLGQTLWADHVVIDSASQLLIPETFESRLNAEVAPSLEQYVDVLWDDAESDQLRCGKGKHPFVAFSIVKSGSLPAGIFYERPCTPHPSSRKCMQEKQIADVRDVVVRLPGKSSKHAYSVNVEEHQTGSGSGNVRTSRRIEHLGTIEGPFQIELSDASKLAIQRYCGRKRKNFAEDLDTEPLKKDNTRLLTIYELKRLHSLWSRTRQRLTGRRGLNWDRLQLSRATIDPVEHSRHSVSIRDLSDALSRAYGAAGIKYLTEMKQQPPSLELQAERGNVDAQIAQAPVSVSVPIAATEMLGLKNAVENGSTSATDTMRTDMTTASHDQGGTVRETTHVDDKSASVEGASVQGESEKQNSDDESRRDESENVSSDQNMENDIVEEGEIGTTQPTQTTSLGITDESVGMPAAVLPKSLPPPQDVTVATKLLGSASIPETAAGIALAPQSSVEMGWPPQLSVGIASPTQPSREIAPQTQVSIGMGSPTQPSVGVGPPTRTSAGAAQQQLAVGAPPQPQGLRMPSLPSKVRMPAQPPDVVLQENRPIQIPAPQNPVQHQQQQQAFMAANPAPMLDPQPQLL